MMGVSACIRNKDHVVIVMPYFEHDRFQVNVRNELEFAESHPIVEAYDRLACNTMILLLTLGFVKLLSTAKRGR